MLTGCGSSGSSAPAPAPSPSPPACANDNGVAAYGDERCYGTSPVCTASANDCYENGMEFVTSTKDCDGTENKCITGNKVRCKPISSCCSGYGYETSSSSPPLCNKCAPGTYNDGGLRGCQKCACDDPSRVRIHCSDSQEGSCVPKKCIHFQSARNCPAGASQPCVFNYQQTTSSTGGTVITVGKQVQLNAADLVKINQDLEHTSFSTTTLSSTDASVIALKPGASSCVFQSVEVKSDGPAVCQQPEISGNVDSGDSDKQCYIAADNAAVDYPVCSDEVHACASSMLGNVTLV